MPPVHRVRTTPHPHPSLQGAHPTPILYNLQGLHPTLIFCTKFQTVYIVVTEFFTMLVVCHDTKSKTESWKIWGIIFIFFVEKKRVRTTPHPYPSL